MTIFVLVWFYVVCVLFTLFTVGVVDDSCVCVVYDLVPFEVGHSGFTSVTQS